MTRRIEVARLITCGLACATVATLSGCGNLVPAKGRVTDGGQPIRVENEGSSLSGVQLQFFRIGPNGQQAAEPEVAYADADGYFEVVSPGQQGIPRGTYRVAVRQWDPYPRIDKLQGRFDERNTPIVREITGQEILIDLSKPKG